ncbi:MAG: peptide-methionine (R)-S-oxide reductase [Candidatus Parcubacteria bacterium]|jgi:peptide-methionine (R)-S-oxide reductase
MNDMSYDESAWKEKLTPEEYKVLREGGTEAPYSGEFYKKDVDGMYHCKACGAALFSTEHQLDSRESNPGLQGWPSFSDAAVAENVGMRPDDSLGMRRTEVFCKHCNSHLGHVFDEEVKGEQRKHFCINSVCLDLEEQ